MFLVVSQVLLHMYLHIFREERVIVLVEETFAQ